MAYFTKRHEVMDLFHGDRQIEKGDWISVKERHPQPKGKGEKVKVKTSDGDEMFAYYYADQNLMRGCHSPIETYWWHVKERVPIVSVTNWKELEPVK